jgi:hypothetical protein
MNSRLRKSFSPLARDRHEMSTERLRCPLAIVEGDRSAYEEIGVTVENLGVGEDLGVPALAPAAHEAAEAGLSRGIFVCPAKLPPGFGIPPPAPRKCLFHRGELFHGRAIVTFGQRLLDGFYKKNAVATRDGLEFRESRICLHQPRQRGALWHHQAADFRASQRL